MITKGLSNRIQRRNCQTLRSTDRIVELRKPTCEPLRKACVLMAFSCETQHLGVLHTTGHKMFRRNCPRIQLFRCYRCSVIILRCISHVPAQVYKRKCRLFILYLIRGSSRMWHQSLSFVMKSLNLCFLLSARNQSLLKLMNLVPAGRQHQHNDSAAYIDNSFLNNYKMP